MVVPQLLCLLFSTTIARADDLDTSSMPTASIVGFAFCGLIASLLLISLFITCLMCYRMQLRDRRDKLLTTAHETHPSLAQISTRQVPSLQPIPGYGLDYPPRPPSLPFYNMQNQSYLVGSESIYPSSSGYVHQNPMTMSSHPIRRHPDYPVEPRIERQNAVHAAGSTNILFLYQCWVFNCLGMIWLRHDPDLWTVARDDTRHSSTEVHFSTDFGCLDTMDFRFRLRRKKSKQSPQLSPFASLKSISNEDLSNGSIYQRFFGPSADPSKFSPDAPSEQSPPAPPISPITPSITLRASRISNALRDAVRMLRLGGDGHHQQREEDTVTLEDANSSLPPSSGVASTAQPNLSASQTRLFRQQKRPMRGSGTMSAALGGVVKIGRRSKASTVSQDSGHCNTFEVTELDGMDSSSSLDNDHFLLSLESAVFTTTPTSSAVTTVVAPLYSFTFQDGDLGDGGSAGSGLLGGWRDGLLYPPLPPGSPVVGFAYLGLGGMDDEEKDEEVAKDDWRRRDEVKLRNREWWMD
uniref:Membrane-associated protein n=1 Tax=Echinococcus canadensis TaxID=519352 RepID=A0A915EZG1_9CEST